MDGRDKSKIYGNMRESDGDDPNPEEIERERGCII
jgi:hypothetical protein